MSEPSVHPSSQELADHYGLVVSTFRHPDCTFTCDYEECDCGGRVEALAYAAPGVEALAARLQATEQALREIDRVLTLHKDMAEDVEDNEAALAEIVGEHPGWYELAVRDWIHDRARRALEGAAE